MFCRNCGSELREGARFCQECGTEVKAGPAVQPSAAVPSEAMGEQAGTEKKEKKEKRAKAEKKSRAGLLVGFAIVLVILIGAGAGAAVYMSPTQKYNRAMKKGAAYMAEEAFSEAVVCYGDALAIRSSREAEKAIVKAYVKYGEECVKTSDYDGAISNFKEALDYDDDNVGALEGLIAAYIGSGNRSLADREYEQADAFYGKALELDENSEEAKEGRLICYIGLGDGAQDGGDYDRALEFYDQVLLWDDTNAAAYCGEAHIAAVQGDVSRAMELLAAGLSYNENDSRLIREKEYLIENTVITAKESIYSSVNRYREEFNDEGILVMDYSYDGDTLSYESAYNDAGSMLWSKSYRYGATSSESTWEYGEDGNLLKYTYTNYADPTYSYRDEYEYDGNGNQTKYTEYNSEDQIMALQLYEYDEKERNTREIAYYYSYDSSDEEEPASSSWSVYTYTYDDHGNIAVTECTGGYDYGGETEEWEPYVFGEEREYDADGRVLVYRSSYYEDGAAQIDYECRYTYDENGNILAEDIVNYGANGDTGEPERYTNEYRYYEDGTELWSRIYVEGGVSEISCNEEGAVLSSRYEELDDSYYSYYDCEYDEHNNKVREVYDNTYGYSVYEYENSYDAFGNLVQVYDVESGRTTTYKYEYKLVK